MTPPADFVAPEGWVEGDPFTIVTTLGRALFNEALPADFTYVNEKVDKKVLGITVNRLAELYVKVDVAETLDGLKSLGFHWASRSGVTISFSDVVAPSAKAELLANAEEKAAKVQQQYERGLITDSERRQELIEIWTRATDEVARAMQDNFPLTNPVHMMVDSGARGNYMQVRQIAGMRGLVANPKGEIIPRPIKSSFKEGLTVLEYFINTHGARKGLADTALRTADSGYLTRRLVDVSQDVIVRETDCGTERGITTVIAEKLADGSMIRDALAYTGLKSAVEAGTKQDVASVGPSSVKWGDVYGFWVEDDGFVSDSSDWVVPGLKNINAARDGFTVAMWFPAVNDCVSTVRHSAVPA
jgi:DNA-directed RNA polymerase subunit beta'